MSIQSDYETWKTSNPTTLPDGFCKVGVLLTEAEFRQLRGKAAVTGDGTFSAALRQAAGMAEVPFGLKRAVSKMVEDTDG